MKVLAVVVTYGSVPPLEECLRALGNQSLHIQTMVVDNGGSAEVAKLCASLGVRYVDPGANLGYGRAVNLGVALSKDTDYLLVINPDVIVRDLNVLYRLLSTSNASIVSCQLERPDGSVDMNLRPIARLSTEAARSVIGGSRAYRAGRTADRRRPVVLQAEQTSGALMLMRLTTWHRLGGFDERFELYYEDVDLCRRALALGPILVLPIPLASHEGGSTFRSARMYAYVAMRVSRLRYLRKWYGQSVGDIAGILIALVEACSRTVTCQPEGNRVRWLAFRRQCEEIVRPGSVVALLEGRSHNPPSSTNA